jgi:hypothetical protein
MLIDTSFFIDDLELPNLTDYSTSATSKSVNDAYRSKLTMLIKRKELEFMTKIVGAGIYNDMLLGLADEDVDSKWVVLKSYLVNDEYKISPIANYCFFFAIAKETRKTVGGISNLNNELGQNLGVFLEQRNAWNKIDEMLFPFYEYLKDNYGLYETETHKLPEFEYKFKQIFY